MKKTKLKKKFNEKEINLKTTLLKKINTFLSKEGFTVNLDISKDISDFDKSVTLRSCSFSCRVKCPYCDKRIKCKFENYWLVSNVEAHLKTHINILKAMGS